jgi:uncharacterized protein YqeY
VTIEDQLRNDQKQAMRDKDTATLNAIRSVQAEVATAKSAPGFSGDVDDDLYLATIATYVRRMRKAKEEYDALGERGAEQAATLGYEIDYLSGFLPQTLGEGETAALVDRVIADLGADAETPPGRVIGAVMKSGEPVDGALVNRIVTERLEAL